MFDLLKEKLSSFKEKIIKKEQALPRKEISRELKPSVSVSSQVKSLVTGEIELTQEDLEGLLLELELSLLEADVEEDTAKKLSEKIKNALVGKKLARKTLQVQVSREIRTVLSETLAIPSLNLLNLVKVKKEKPFKILFLGPNGHGKTTTIAKLCFLLQKNNFKAILSASDTFRAASIEQIEKHASNLGVRVIKHQYGSDPAAVAFDAVKAAESSHSDVVLIDSAGRQETNKNLMEELKKIVRVVQPDLKIFVGEALAGKSLLEQAKKFDDALTLDGFILTKIDTDTKGGTIISLLSELKKPILFIGTGQNYEDLQEFYPEFLIDRIL